MPARFNPPPGWPAVPQGWSPPPGWQPDPAWPAAPYGWSFWVEEPVPAQWAPAAAAVGPPSPPPAPWSTAPGPVPHALLAAPHIRRVDNSAAWALASAPILLILVDIVFLQFGWSTVDVLAFAVAAAINGALAYKDQRNLEQVGVSTSAWWAVFLVPVYLLMRTRKAHQTWLVPATWTVCFIAYIGAGQLVGTLGGVELDSSLVETQIEDGYADIGQPGVEAQCPEPAIAPVGGTVTCSATYPSGATYEVLVTVENAGGWITFEEWGKIPAPQ